VSRFSLMGKFAARALEGRTPVNYLSDAGTARYFHLLPFCEYLDERAREKVAVAPGPCSHQIAIDNDIFISIDRSHVPDVT
jgi:hypothetical protein